MPIVNNSSVIWQYSPEENVYLTPFKLIRRLIIVSDTDPEDPECFQVPSLDIFSRLTQLELIEMDVENMPKIPDSVNTLVITHTNITNLNQINVNWVNISTLVLVANPYLNGTSLLVPTGVVVLKIENQQLDLIRLPGSILDVVLTQSSITLLTGVLPIRNLSLISSCSLYHSESIPIYKYFQRDWLPFHAQRFGNIQEHNHLSYLKRIADINNAENYKIYLDFGSIPHRIRVSENNINNPIVVALKLCSNYPRRMAEFVCEETIFPKTL